MPGKGYTDPLTLPGMLFRYWTGAWQLQAATFMTTHQMSVTWRNEPVKGAGYPAVA